MGWDSPQINILKISAMKNLNEVANKAEIRQLIRRCEIAGLYCVYRYMWSKSYKGRQFWVKIDSGITKKLNELKKFNQ